MRRTKQELSILIMVNLSQQEPQHGRILPITSLPPSVLAVLWLKYVLPWMWISELEAKTAPEKRRRTFEQAFSDAGYDGDKMLVYCGSRHEEIYIQSINCYMENCKGATQ